MWSHRRAGTTCISTLTRGPSKWSRQLLQGGLAALLREAGLARQRRPRHLGHRVQGRPSPPAAGLLPYRPLLHTSLLPQSPLLVSRASVRDPITSQKYNRSVPDVRTSLLHQAGSRDLGTVKGPGLESKIVPLRKQSEPFQDLSFVKVCRFCARTDG